MSNLIDYAKREFKACGYIPLDQPQEENPDKWIQENVIELLKVFEKQGHSGFSAPFCINMFSKLAKFEPLTPLSGEPDEWMEVSKGLFQNTRCSHVFKDAELFNGQAYDLNGKVFRRPNGDCYTRGEGRVPIEFPYTPKTEYVDVPE